MSSRQQARIPLIDLGSSNAASELLDAAATFGFVFVKHENVGLAPEDVDEMFRISRDFFSSPTSVKAECTIHSATSGKNHGWLSMQTETLDPANQKRGDLKEAFNIGEFDGGRPQQPFPTPLQAYERHIGEFMEVCHHLCNRILKLFAVALEISDSEGGANWFSSRHDRSKGASGSILRLLYYPHLSSSAMYNSEEDIRAGAHSDYGSVTLLFRLPSQPGLEILTPAGDWATVPVDPDPASGSTTLPILVNIGDLLSFWTNGLLKSTVHRVIFPNAKDQQEAGADRYSIAYFCHPEDEAELVEVPSEKVKELGRANGGLNGATDKAMTAREHLNSRLAATYGIKA